MSIFSKLITALRGGATEVGQGIVDIQAIRILDQELADSKTAQDEAKSNLTVIMAEKMGMARKIKALNFTIKEHEDYVIQAKEIDDEGLALDVASTIAEFESEMNIQQGIFEGYESKVLRMKKMIRQTECNIQAMEREISVVKSTEKVQKANELAAEKLSGSNSALNLATESLEKIQLRQQMREDQITAALELETAEKESGLKQRLKNAGVINIDSSASSVLERLKKQ